MGAERNPGVQTQAPPPGAGGPGRVTQPVVASRGKSPDVLAGPGTMGKEGPSRRNLEVAGAPPLLIHPCFRPGLASFSLGILSPPNSTLLWPCSSVLSPNRQTSLLYTPYPVLSHLPNAPRNSLPSHSSLVIPESPKLPVSPVLPSLIHTGPLFPPRQLPPLSCPGPPNPLPGLPQAFLNISQPSLAPDSPASLQLTPIHSLVLLIPASRSSLLSPRTAPCPYLISPNPVPHFPPSPSQPLRPPPRSPSPPLGPRPARAPPGRAPTPGAGSQAAPPRWPRDPVCCGKTLVSGQQAPPRPRAAR